MISRVGEVTWHLGIYGFQTCAFCHEVLHRELFTNIPSLLLVFWQYFFSRHLRFMTTGEDRNKNPFKNWKPCVPWKRTFRHHETIKLTQNCVCFTNPCINPFVPTSVTGEYHPKVLERLHLLQLTCRKHCLGCLKRHNTSTFSVLIFIPAWSHASEIRSNASWSPCEDPRVQYQFVRKRQKVHPAVPNSDTLVDASVTVYPIDIDQGSSHFLGKITQLLHNSSRARHLA